MYAEQLSGVAFCILLHAHVAFTLTDQRDLDETHKTESLGDYSSVGSTPLLMNGIFRRYRTTSGESVRRLTAAKLNGFPLASKPNDAASKTGKYTSVHQRFPHGVISNVLYTRPISSFNGPSEVFSYSRSSVQFVKESRTLHPAGETLSFPGGTTTAFPFPSEMAKSEQIENSTDSLYNDQTISYSFSQPASTSAHSIYTVAIDMEELHHGLGSKLVRAAAAGIALVAGALSISLIALVFVMWHKRSQTLSYRNSSSPELAAPLISVHI